VLRMLFIPIRALGQLIVTIVSAVGRFIASIFRSCFR
jgi:hypothetical protein